MNLSSANGHLVYNPYALAAGKPCLGLASAQSRQCFMSLGLSSEKYPDTGSLQESGMNLFEVVLFSQKQFLDYEKAKSCQLAAS